MTTGRRFADNHTEGERPSTAPQNESMPSSDYSFASYIPEVVRKNAMLALQADVPRGASGVTALTWAQSPTLTEVRQGAITTERESHNERLRDSDNLADTQSSRPARAQSLSKARRASAADTMHSAPSITSRDDAAATENNTKTDPTRIGLTHQPTITELTRTPTGTYPNGYKFPAKHTWQESVSIGLRAFFRFTFTSWIGAFVALYAVNVIGWGGMIFLLLCGGGDSRMCWTEEDGILVKDCSSKHTSKSLWIEIDAQVLTALFCVTAFGLLPWRLRDSWHILQYRIWHEHLGLRKLAAAHKGWFRLPNSHHLDPLVSATDLRESGDQEAMDLVPYPLTKAAPPPLTGLRAHPTKVWKMDFVVWMMFMNSVFQVILCGFMWGQNRYVRPAWATALFIVLGMLSGIAAGVVQFIEGKKIKQREGVPHVGISQPAKESATEHVV